MSRFLAIIAAGLMSAAFALPAAAHGGGGGFHGGGFHGGGFHGDFHGRGGFGGGIFLGDPLYPYPYGVSGLYSYPYPTGGYGYFCPAANAFYPTVTSCAVGWQLLPAQ